MLKLAVPLLLALCAPVVAQSKSFTSPRGFELFEGDAWAYGLGRYASGRTQIIEGDHRGTSGSITAVQYRHDATRSYQNYSGQGRTWSSVSVRLSDTDRSKLSTTYANNVVGTQTEVFRAAVSWPTMNGFATTTPPARWGGNGKLAFKFSKSWTYSGKRDFMMDFDFRGGKLANSGSWSGSTSSFYYLDSLLTGTESSSGRFLEWLPSVDVRCNDSAITFTDAAYTTATSKAYGDGSSVVQLRNKIVMSTYSYYVAPGASVIHAFTVGHIKGGVLVGAWCHRLYIDVTLPWVAVPFRTIPGHERGYSGDFWTTVGWHPLYSSLPLYIQGAWTDSKTGRFSLTRCSRIALPAHRPLATKPKRSIVFGATAGAALADQGPYDFYFYLPITHYSVK